MRFVYEGFRVPLVSVISIRSFVDLLLLLEDGVTLTLTLGRRVSVRLSLPSKYSISREVWDW